MAEDGIVNTSFSVLKALLLELTLFNERKNIANTNYLTLQYFYEGDYCFMLNSSCSI